MLRTAWYLSTVIIYSVYIAILDVNNAKLWHLWDPLDHCITIGDGRFYSDYHISFFGEMSLYPFQ